MNKAVNKLKVDTRPSKFVVVDSLTRDISIQACIFDLIDNAVDAARDTIYKIHPEIDKEIPPPSYKGFKIQLTINGDLFSISDNCGGISITDLENTALKFGDRSSHNMGIGVFGVGLNRAIFRLGKHTTIATDTGLERAALVLDTEAYLNSDDWYLPAERLPTTKIIGTKIEITKLPTENSQVFADRVWLNDLTKEISRRYCKLLDKDLNITINSLQIESLSIKIRINSPYEGQTKIFRAPNVSVFIESGQHEQHRFTAEPDYNKDTNASLTSEYGWTIYCNDRAIVISDKSRKTGWTKAFHSEFYGFVGNIHFTSKDPSLLPWNTTKTDVDLNNIAYQMALSDMEKFVAQWRSDAGDAKRRKRKNETITSPPASSETGGNSGEKNGKKEKEKENPSSKPTQPTKKPTIKIDHNTFSTILPQDIDELHCDEKHLALVHEAKRLDLNQHTYSGLVLIRILFETSTICYLARHDMYDDLKSTIIESRNQDKIVRGLKPLTVKETKHLEPSLDEILSFLSLHDEIWDTARRNKLKQSLTRFAAHKPILNSAAHNAFQPINRLTAFAIREEILPALRYLIEN
ncbi:ATP-binding protein [Pseudomonas sp. NPDC099000]|uniref:ATP-binding protein n=1 Tax=Pseudomonas sp. NPDC099000 TaxID=3364488 RepID=UPI00383B50D8